MEETLTLQDRVGQMITGFPGVAGVGARNLTTGEEVSVNDRESFPTASMIKILILFELVRQCARGQAQMWERITLRGRDKTLGSGLLLDFDEGANLTLRDLAVMMMAISDNTATNILIDRLGLHAINEACREGGMQDTELRNKVDFDLIRESNDNLAVGTPRDFCDFLTALYRNELMPQPYVEQMLGIMRIQKYMNLTLRRYLPYDPYAFEFGHPQETWIASKTGGLSGVRCEAGLIHTERTDWAICVMTKGYKKEEAGSDDPGSRFIAEISRAVYNGWVEELLRDRR
jgi:beta-lactamase class A